MNILTKALIGVAAEFTLGIGVCYAIGRIKESRQEQIQQDNVRKAIDDGIILIKTNTVDEESI